ncbi:ABC transporter permease [Raoultella sp. RIT712]|uniref:ABC transporter permease n=1 Tax=Raoultella sp. RIT712 TaxID=2666191 RepID=UPI0012AE7203|nr:ABC transporter permease [Raoultella sp. RIT712]MRT49297.1 ABC transporter permease subunit [Raoultella sp. RIT712]
MFNRKGNSLSWLMFAPLCLLLMLVVGSLLSLIVELDFSTLVQVLREPELHFAVAMSVVTALLSLLLSLLIGVPAAWMMARTNFRGKGFIDALLDIPVVTPPLIVGIGLLLLLGQRGPMSGIFPQLPTLLFSPLGVIIGQTYVASAIVVRSASAAFASLDPAYIATAHNLGLTPVRTLLLVEIPLCWPSLLSGGVLALARALGEFGATLMLAGAIRFKTETLPMAVYLNIASGDFSLAIGCALLLMLLAGLLLVALHRIQRLYKTREYVTR